MTDINPRSNDHSVFPNPVYKETVLRPLFDALLHEGRYGGRG